MRRAEQRPAAQPGSPPPSRFGVGASCVAMQAGGWHSVLEFLVARFPRIEQAQWKARLDAADVVDDQGRAVAADEACRPGERLYYFRSILDEPVLPMQETVIYQDARIAVVDKPHGMAVVPAGRHLRETLLARIRRRLGNDAATPVHRIDRDTAGLVLFSLDPGSRDAYHSLFRDRKIEKHYEAIATYDPALTLPLLHRSRMRASPESFMQMCEVEGDPNAETRIELLGLLQPQGGHPLARFGLQPLTGLRHQLRVQLSGLGSPILNDRIYPILQPDPAGDRSALLAERAAPLQLLAKRLSFVDPVSGEMRAFQSELTLLRAADSKTPAAAGNSCQREV